MLDLTMPAFAPSRLRASHDGYRRQARLWTSLTIVGVMGLVGAGLVYHNSPTDPVRYVFWAMAACLLLGALGWAVTTYRRRRSWQYRGRELDAATRTRVQAELGAALDAAATNGVAPIHAALKQGADPRLPDDAGRPWLVRAVNSGSPAAVQMLVESGYDLEQMGLPDALLEALRAQDEASLHWLLQAGADPYAPGTEGIKPATLVWDEREGGLTPRVWVMLWSYLDEHDKDRVEEWVEKLPAGRRDALKSWMDMRMRDPTRGEWYD